MDLETAYNKLLVTPGYSFFVDWDGKIHEWEPKKAKQGWLDKICGISEIKSDLELHVVPGSFNPLHDSHREIFQHAFSYLPDLTVTAPPGLACYEMSINRFDKPPVTLEQLTERLQQFRGETYVLVSRASRFIDKIETYRPHVGKLTFHIGIDTIIRMKSDYGLRGIEDLKAKFVVYDRIISDKLQTLETECAEYMPKNCQMANMKRSHESLIRSSTAIRNHQV